MGTRHNPGRDKQLDSARKIARATEEKFLDPAILFGHASNDDLAVYTPEMLAHAAIYAAGELTTWDRTTARISIDTVPFIEFGGTALSVLSITDRNMPFLYDSIMGEVTATYRDIHLAVHPLLTMPAGGEIEPFSAERPGDAADHVSHIQLHLSPLTSAQSTDLIQRVRSVLDKVHLAISDWQPMLSRLDATIAELSQYHATAGRPILLCWACATISIRAKVPTPGWSGAKAAVLASSRIRTF